MVLASKLCGHQLGCSQPPRLCMGTVGLGSRYVTSTALVALLKARLNTAVGNV